MYGDFSPDRRVAIASASKLVSGVTLFRLIDQGYLSLDSTTGQVLGWTGDEGAITLRELMSFTSGLQPENRCTYQSDAILGMEDRDNRRTHLGAALEQQLKPLIVEALSHE
jgi:CubicO group peptidase (beta-lactamase class C family)